MKHVEVKKKNKKADYFSIMLGLDQLLIYMKNYFYCKILQFTFTPLQY